MHVLFSRILTSIVTVLSFILVAFSTYSLAAISVHVTSDGHDVSDAKVELWQAVPAGKPVFLEKATSDKQGKVAFNAHSATSNQPLYLISAGGKIKNDSVPNLSLFAIIPIPAPSSVILNELTTIGSLWPNAQQFALKEGLQGTANGLVIGSSQVDNLINVSTGYFSKVALNSANLTQSETVARMNTLGALVSLCGANSHKGLCNEFLAINSSSSTLESLLKIAKAPYLQTQNYFSLFDKAFPYPKGEQRRDVNFLPYLSFVPDDFSLQIKFTGGGIYSPGRMMFDNRANLWSGQNWMPGSQSGLISSIGGGVVRLGPDGSPISPAITGYNGQGLDGVGWGTTVSNDKVWISTFNKKVGVFDLDGKPLGPAKVDGKVGMLQGLATSPNGDVWICDNQLNQMLKFPNGDHNRGEVVNVSGLQRPFAVAVDNNNVVWVTNSASMTVTRFPADSPSEAKQIKVGVAPRGLAVDSLGNVWVAANLSPGYPLPKIPKGAGILEEFKISIENILAHEKQVPVTGNVTMISPEGKVLKSDLLNGKINGGWGVSIDGDDTVFVSNFLGTGFMHMCGAKEDVCPQGVSSGDLIHYYRSGLMEEVTDTMIDEAGNVWVANNWNVISALLDENPDRRTSTMGGGDGIVVIYGIAKPVLNPLIGAVRPVSR
ncbi:NHL repeat-containing protein [Halodesulfovibrio marinisediminis]|uniref:Streptogramin lyase n=1 Tax=Halodesulfovibrio marinisediminis DSM 17456 TaxID=1121457 RepID=A0A1N6J8J1_9BACT|nr:hypothetical protein [Halodesulfovibrio marinisediminis]SIO40551.1 hypothetical protein SAMN02745161_3216 [Halodesulfovibrio marinisediminis DSM 17456]